MSDHQQTLLSEADIDASTRLARALLDFARILGASPAHNPGELPTEQVIRVLLKSPTFINGLLAGSLKLLSETETEEPQC